MNKYRVNVEGVSQDSKGILTYESATYTVMADDPEDALLKLATTIVEARVASDELVSQDDFDKWIWGTT